MHISKIKLIKLNNYNFLKIYIFFYMHISKIKHEILNT